ncbi:MAG: putative lipid II flippase FtsW [Candidatus Omnitrophica bacterium]|nr:putative lipid II flippase FtsW [Candidatus Omnitrophota bacterium]
MSKEGKILFVTVYLLVSFGIVMTYSASAIYAEQVFKSPTYFLIRQIIYAVIGTVFLFLVAGRDPYLWKEHSREILIFSILLLTLVFVPLLGHEAGGARRWVRLGPFNFQPSEISKLAICLYLSDYLSRRIKGVQRGELSVLLPPLLILGLTCGLILLQPDLGSSVFIFIVSAILLFLAGIPLRYVLFSSLIFVPAFYFLVVRIPYRLSRVTAYLNPWSDPQGSGFQIIQSLLAFGLGGIKGVGLGESTQKLFYLPQSYNDFIFSIIAEELGILGTFSVILLYFVILLAGLKIASRARGSFEKLFVISLVLLIVLQAIINMFVATGLIPTKGLPLPFVSYGGSSLVFNLLGVGLLLAMDRAVQRGRGTIGSA